MQAANAQSPLQARSSKSLFAGDPGIATKRRPCREQARSYNSPWTPNYRTPSDIVHRNQSAGPCSGTPKLHSPHVPGRTLGRSTTPRSHAATPASCLPSPTATSKGPLPSPTPMSASSGGGSSEASNAKVLQVFTSPSASVPGGGSTPAVLARTRRRQSDRGSHVQVPNRIVLK